MFLYRPLSTVHHPGTITEEEAYRDKGLKVRLGPTSPSANGKGARTFSVEVLESRSLLSNTKLVVMIIIGITLFFVLAGGLFMKFCVPFIINSYLNYPQANCTVISCTRVAGDSGWEYVLGIEYFDANNIEHYGTISKSERQFAAQNFTTGTEFACMYKGSFLMDKATIQNQLSYASTIWYWGLVIPIPSCLFIYGFMYIFLRMLFLRGTVSYYNRASQVDKLVVDSWGPIPTELRQFFSVLMHSLHAEESLTSQGINFRRSVKDRSAVTKTVLIVMAIMIFAMFAGMFFAAYFLGFGYTATQYLMSIFLVIDAFPLLAVGIFSLQMGLLSRYSVDTNEYTIQYGVRLNQISGSIMPLDTSSIFGLNSSKDVSLNPV